MLLVLARLSLRHRRLSSLILIVATLALGAGALRLQSDVGYRAFLGAGHPAVTRFEDFLARFDSGLPIVAVWSCAESPACDEVFDPAALRMMHAVSTSLRALPGVARIDSPATTPLITPQLIGLPEARRLFENGRPAADVAALIASARVDPLWRGQLVSEDGRAAAMVVHLESSDGELSRRVYNALRAALAPHESAGFVFHLAGGPVEFVVAGEELERAIQRIVPLMVALIAVVLALLLTSLHAAALVLVNVGVAIVWSIGLMGWLGWPQNSLTQALIPTLLVIGVCDGIHLLARFGALPADGPLEQRLQAAVRDVGWPCLLTTLTTVAGFGSLAVSPLESIARFGTIAALGVAFALMLTFTLLPLMIASRPPRAPRTSVVSGWDGILVKLAALAVNRRTAVLAATSLLAVVSLWGLLRLQVDATFEDLYGRDSQVVRWAHSVERLLRPPETLEIAIDPGRVLGEATPSRFEVLARVERELDGIDGLRGKRSILDAMRHLNQLLRRRQLGLEDESEDGRPRSLLRLLRQGDAELVDLFVGRERGALRLMMNAEKLPQARLRVMLAEVERRLEATVPRDWTTIVTGPVAIVSEMIDAIRSTQLQSFALAAVLVFGLILPFLGSLRLALIAMVPTLLPVATTLGVMGLLGIALDVGSAMVAAVVLGLAIDNAIHLLAAYRRERHRGGSVEDACRRAVIFAGRPLATSSIALAAGFFTLLLSPWNSVALFGAIAAIAIASALLAALVVVPALLLVLED